MLAFERPFYENCPCCGGGVSLRQNRRPRRYCHDWQTGLLPMLLRHDERQNGAMLAKKTVFTVHNIAFQGKFPSRLFDSADLPDEIPGIGRLKQKDQVNFLKGGLLFADQVTTVSPQYAREIRTIEFGCGLDAACGKTSAGQRRHWPTSGCIGTPLEQPAMITMCNFQNHPAHQRQWQHSLIKNGTRTL